MSSASPSFPVGHHKRQVGNGADIALDRDAGVILSLSFEPPSANAKPTSWLLLHTIPVTASLTTVLGRLFEAQASAAPAATAVAATPPAFHEEHVDHEGQSSLEHSPQQQPSAGTAISTGAPLSPPASACSIDLVRVGCVLSEIHAYCLLLRSGGPSHAAALKTALERGAALGLTNPVEYVRDGEVTVRCRRELVSEEMEEGTVVAPLIMRLPLAEAVLHGVATSGGSGTSWSSGNVRVVGLDTTGESGVTGYVSSPLTPAGGPGWRLQSQRLSAAHSAPATPATHTPLMNAVPPSPRFVATSFSTTGAGVAAAPTHTTVPSSAAPLLLPPSSGTSEEHCPICQVEPLSAHPCLITLCHHTYHLACYAQLASAECPLCRFSLYSLLSDVRCEACGTYEDLWSCLLCGYVGCGRGRRHHQRAHYEETGHSTALQSSTNRIWNEASRMFLNQEVALVLDAFECGRGAASGNSGSGGCGTAATTTTSDLTSDALWLLPPSESEARDAELQAALTESREEAVQDYYVRTMHELIEEQRRWYETQESALVAAVMRQRDVKEVATAAIAMTATASAAKSPTNVSTTAAVQLTGLPAEELVARRGIAAAYSEGARQLLGGWARTLRGLVERQRQRQEDAQEQVLLLSHRANGLRGGLSRLRQRIADADTRGAKEYAEKKEEQRLLEERVAEALSRLTAS